MLAGTTSIRAYRRQGEFFENMQKSLDMSTLTTITLNAVPMWLMIRLDTMLESLRNGFQCLNFASCSDRTSAVSFFIAVIAAAAGTAVLPAGYLGLALTYSFQLNESVKSTVQNLS